MDRDGVINKEKNYLYKISDFEFEENALEGLRLINFEEYSVFIISNQAGIAKGFYKKEDAEKLDNWLRNFLKKEGIKIAKSYFCPHHPDAKVKKYKKKCLCRKPETGMFLKAEKEFGVDLGKSYSIGDKTSDILAGQRAGCRTILAKTGYAGKDKLFKIKPDFVADNLVEAIKIVNDAPA